MAPICSELWGHSLMPETIDLDCLLPSGILITVQCSRETTLNEVKLKVWEENRKYKFVNEDHFKSIENYIFVSVSQEAKLIEYYDNDRRICDLKLFYAAFKLLEVQGDLVEKAFNSNLSKAIGLHLNEIEQNSDLEIVEFRLQLLRILHAVLLQQNKINSSQSFKALIDCVYPPYLEIDPSLLDTSVLHTANSLDCFSFTNKKRNAKNAVEINVHVSETDQPEQTFSLAIPLSYTPIDVVISVIKEKLFLMKKHSNEQIEEIVKVYKDSYILNVCGCHEIFNGNFIF